MTALDYLVDVLEWLIVCVSVIGLIGLAMVVFEGIRKGREW
jgi:hypothetical protein